MTIHLFFQLLVYLGYLYIGGAFMLLLYFLFGSFMASVLMCFFDHREDIRYFLFGRSKCDYCNSTLAWYNLIPIFSFLISRGRCTHCNTKLSARYIMIEFFIGLVCMIFLPKVISHDPNFIFPFLVITIMMISDLTDYFVSDALQIILLISFVYYLLFTNHPYYFISSIILFLTFFGCNLLLPNSIGGADLKFVFIVGLLLEPMQLPYFIFIAALSGLIILIVTKIHPLPFIPFLSVSFLLLYVQFFTP